MSQCRVLAKYLRGAEGVRRHIWPSSSLWFRSEETEEGGGVMLKSPPPTDVVSEPVTFTPDPFTI